MSKQPWVDDQRPRPIDGQTIVRAALEGDKKKYRSKSVQPHAYASEATACARTVGYRLLKEATDGGGSETPMSWLVARVVGSLIHDLVEAQFAVEYPDFRDEVRWDLGYISGRADGLFTAHDVPTVLEIKTMSNSRFEPAYRRGRPQSHHVLQANLSVHALEAGQCMLIYINKNPRWGVPTVFDWVLPFDKDARAETTVELDRLRTVVELTGRGVVPDRIWRGDVVVDPESGKQPCTYCAYVTSCAVDGPGEHAR